LSKPLGRLCWYSPVRQRVKTRETRRGLFFGIKMARLPTPAIDRVMSRIVRLPESGCWIFMGALNEAGYGIVGNGSRSSGVDRAHRITYRHFKGEIPKGLFVCHHCDIPSCCNPDHLFIGTNHENVIDCVRKKRNSKPPVNSHIKGVVHVKHKLNDDIVKEIRAMNGVISHRILANKFGVCRQTVSDIASGKKWKHVK